MLSNRRQQILCALIEEYVANACPVGSRTIAEHHDLGVSPATIRNELSALEEAGYIAQPHTSAGRIPTDAGYREFVDELLAQADETQRTAALSQIESIRRSAEALDDLIERTNAELARLTQCLSVIMAPQRQTFRIRQISLVSLTDHSALTVLVTEDGQVANEHAVFASPATPEDIRQMEAALNELLQGRTTDEMASEKWELALRDGRAKAVFRSLQVAATRLVRAHSTRSGMSTLMRKPEFHESEALLPVMEILEDDTVLFKAIGDNGLPEGDICIRIGKENVTERLFGVSVIAGIYGRGDAQGIVAVIGPTRMDYSKTIGAVRAAQDVLRDE